jgi:uncharacterized protein (DUF488 family)
MSTLHTIGHGNRGLEDLIGLLRAAQIECVIDVRAYPNSRRNPRFAKPLLEPALTARGIRYLWEGKALGGMRRPCEDSPNIALADAAFRGFADHMAGAEFTDAIQRLVETGREQTAAIMCAETDPQHCHRSFIADALLLRGVRVLHLVGPKDTREHAVQAGARATANGKIIYDARIQLGLAL